MLESSEHPASRRTVLGHFAGAAAASGAGLTTTSAAAAAETDAELIELCARFVELERRITDAGEQAAEALSKEQAALIPRICCIRASNSASLRARAHALVAWAPDVAEGAEDGGRCWDQRLLAAVVRDLLV